ncbi:MAG: hypothetical protein OXC46_11500 [Thaumarchaeota archaeon]|nr:hypothetical protein [Nitrososphaerota archaeon]
MTLLSEPNISSDMPEIKSWDTVFFVKALNQNIGVRIYYEADPEKCNITYTGKTKEFGLETITYSDNPEKGCTTTYTYEFSIVTSKPYSVEENGEKFICMDIKAEAVQNTEIKNSTIKSLTGQIIDDGKIHQDTVRIKCS